MAYKFTYFQKLKGIIKKITRTRLNRPLGDRLRCLFFTLLENLEYQLVKTFPDRAGGVLGGEGDGEELNLNDDVSNENLLNIFATEHTYVCIH